MINVDNKHDKYESQYQPNDLFWGFGIETELYLEFEKEIAITEDFVLKCHQKERYSLDYFANYKPGIIHQMLKSYWPRMTGSLPLLLNSHTLTKMDVRGQHGTVYSKNRESNPKYSGKSLYDELIEMDEFFRTNKNYIFDGDSIEIMTYNFYKAQLQTVLNELYMLKSEFIKHLQQCQKKLNYFLEFGSITWMKKNYPLACFMSNHKNISVFCNGTYHINITLPSELNSNCRIQDFDKFRQQHQIFIRLIQYFEPFLVAIYGQKDPFSDVYPGLSQASQRGAISRYIGIAVYDTETMLQGKLLQIDIDKLPNIFWYKKYVVSSNYRLYNKIGYDINFNKYVNHGVEIRCFEYMSNDQLEALCSFLILLADVACHLFTSNSSLPNPRLSVIFFDFICHIMQFGSSYTLSTDEYNFYNSALDWFQCRPPYTVINIYQQIFDILKKKYAYSGQFSKLLLIPTISADQNTHN